MSGQLYLLRAGAAAAGERAGGKGVNLGRNSRGGQSRRGQEEQAQHVQTDYENHRPYLDSGWSLRFGSQIPLILASLLSSTLSRPLYAFPTHFTPFPPTLPYPSICCRLIRFHKLYYRQSCLFLRETVGSSGNKLIIISS